MMGSLVDKVFNSKYIPVFIQTWFPPSNERQNSLCFGTWEL